MTKNKKITKNKKTVKTHTSNPGGIGGELEGNTNQQVDASSSRGNQVKHWFFTWNNYTEENIQQMLESFNKHCYRWRFEEELGESETPHLQGVCSVKKDKGIRWSEFKLPKEIHWEKVHNLQKASKYCEKDFISHGRRLWEHGYPTRLRLITNLRPFQTQLAQMLEAEPDDRHIICIYDPHGNMGKTQFMKYWCYNNIATFTTGGNYNDIAFSVSNYFDDKSRDINAKWTFFMALPRDQDMEHVSYRALEAIKDGFMSSNKYESHGLIFNSPHVVMLTNNLPIRNRRDGSETMTHERWQVYSINNNFELEIYEPWYA